MKPHVDRTDWFEQAACRDWSPRVFFWDSGSRSSSDPLEHRKMTLAKAICGRCPVRRQCLEYALESERAGSTKLGMAQFSWNVYDANRNLVGNKFHWREFTASVTPPFGIWGGIDATQRHRKDIKHVELDGKTCVNGMTCPGCRPTDEWVEMLLKEDAA